MHHDQLGTLISISIRRAPRELFPSSQLAGRLEFLHFSRASRSTPGAKLQLPVLSANFHLQAVPALRSGCSLSVNQRTQGML
ncbi:MAG TPA: hypothetical protein VK728_16830, partial [Candidatus Sulfotelmatobacter sp.]|nr:hypothetical protein [Candidatus Sulfotelmatobacter sp.]